MDTNLLNQYIFADIVDRHAQRIWRKRIEANPESTKELTKEDLEEALKNLDWIRLQSLNLL